MTTLKVRDKDKILFAQPFVKWAGGKRQLLPDIRKNLPVKQNVNSYYEPFVGGGALLFDLQPKSAVINDFNSELMNAYQIIKSNVDELILDLEKHENTSEYFYQMREKDRNGELEKMSDVERASRLIYLNKTCFNGLFRVNSKNQFNVPFGNYKNPNWKNTEVLKGVSNYLQEVNVRILNKDFEEAVSTCEAGDFIYFDPPYDNVSEDSKSFVGYTLDGFGRGEQKRLANVFKELDEKGCYILLSNAYTDFIKEIYDGFYIKEVLAKRRINSRADGRGNVSEVLIRNYDV